MENSNPPEKCEKCGAKLVERKGISQRNNKPFHFWGCSNYPTCDYTWRPPSKENKNHEEEMEALRKIYAKLNEMDDKIELGFGQLLVEKEDKPKK